MVDGPSMKREGHVISFGLRRIVKFIIIHMDLHFFNTGKSGVGSGEIDFAPFPSLSTSTIVYPYCCQPKYDTVAGKTCRWRKNTSTIRLFIQIVNATHDEK
jgi:hypothetical protein